MNSAAGPELSLFLSYLAIPPLSAECLVCPVGTVVCAVAPLARVHHRAQARVVAVRVRVVER